MRAGAKTRHRMKTAAAAHSTARQTRAKARLDGGAGQTAYTPAAAAAHRPNRTGAGAWTVMTETGADARKRAARHARAASASHGASAKAARDGSSADSGTQASPTTSRALTRGPTATLASGERIARVPNAGRTTGSVNAWATQVMASGSTTQSGSRAGARARTQPHARPENAVRPKTESTDSEKPMSAAHVGSTRTMANAAIPTPDSAWARRPATVAPRESAAITHDRTADGCSPVNTT